MFFNVLLPCFHTNWMAVGFKIRRFLGVARVFAFAQSDTNFCTFKSRWEWVLGDSDTILK
jgi:hypothetical protein